MLELRDVRSGYGKLEVIKGVSLDLDSGTLHALIGPNGAGKTTLLRAIVGLLPVFSGEVALDGESLLDRSPGENARAGVALVPESRDLFAGLTVKENISLGAYARRSTARGSLTWCLGLFPALAKREAQLAGSLSGGEQQMVAIARALMSHPRVLLLDEPSLGLGPKVVSTLFEVVDMLRQEGTAVLLVEQNVKAALAVADHAYVLERGEITVEGSASALATDERVVGAYLGQTSQN
jgi:branched-chain amino acid transport system ATP-binding protein